MQKIERIYRAWTNRIAFTRQRIHQQIEYGMATAEYAIGTLAAAAFAGILLVVVKSGGIKSALMSIIQSALST